MKKIFMTLFGGALLAAAGWYYLQARAPADDQVATSAREVGATLGDASIIVRIKAKHFVDADLSVLAINVDCRDGRVTLAGTAASPALIERATRLARETGGVRDVASRLTVRE